MLKYVHAVDSIDFNLHIVATANSFHKLFTTDAARGRRNGRRALSTPPDEPASDLAIFRSGYRGGSDRRGSGTQPGDRAGVKPNRGGGSDRRRRARQPGQVENEIPRCKGQLARVPFPGPGPKVGLNSESVPESRPCWDRSRGARESARRVPEANRLSAGRGFEGHGPVAWRPRLRSLRGADSTPARSRAGRTSASGPTAPALPPHVESRVCRCP